mmetsp:Transcript_6972/g.25683  ORF Transcript_6972/g.25683 Transcript_6972/m.25683 type:complete len:383 (-) Transcript_6972:696-1844(-)
MSTPNNYEKFTRSIARTVVAQIVSEVAIQHRAPDTQIRVHESAVDCLSDILIRYVVEIGHATHSYSELAGRTECNLLDVFMGLSDLSKSDKIATDVQELLEHMKTAPEVPFIRPVPVFPVRREASKRLVPSFSEAGEQAPKHIPDFLPAFPDPHTYKHTPTFSGRAEDAGRDKVLAHEQRRKAEEALMNLHTRTAAAGGTAAAEPADTDVAVEKEKVPPLQLLKAEQELAVQAAGKEAARSNPFLRAPKGPTDELAALQAHHNSCTLNAQAQGQGGNERPSSPAAEAVAKLEQALLQRAEEEGQPREAGRWTELSSEPAPAMRQSLFSVALENAPSIWRIDQKRKRPLGGAKGALAERVGEGDPAKKKQRAKDILSFFGHLA